MVTSEEISSTSAACPGEPVFAANPRLRMACAAARESFQSPGFGSSDYNQYCVNTGKWGRGCVHEGRGAFTMQLVSGNRRKQKAADARKSICSSSEWRAN